MLLYQIDNRRTACDNDIVHLSFLHKTHIFPCNNRSPLCRLTHLGKSELQQCIHDLTGVFVIQKPAVRWIQRNYHTLFFIQQAFHIRQVAVKGLRLLRTDFHTVSTVNTHICNNLRLSLFDTDCFDITISQTFITMRTVCILKINYIHILIPPPWIYFTINHQ